LAFAQGYESNWPGGFAHATIDRKMAARRRSLLYLEKLRLFHAGVTVILVIALLAWAIVLWQKGAATAVAPTCPGGYERQTWE
jgi:hypothetical protein